MARNLVRIDVERRAPVAGGMAFGDTGPYEWLAGKAYYAIDPNEAGAALHLRSGPGAAEPRRPGRVRRHRRHREAGRPRAAATGACSTSSPTAAVGPRSPRFNYGKGRDLSNPESAGDGFLMRLGYTVMWSGWQGDLIDRGTNVVAYLPEAQQDGQPAARQGAAGVQHHPARCCSRSGSAPVPRAARMSSPTRSSTGQRPP